MCGAAAVPARRDRRLSAYLLPAAPRVGLDGEWKLIVPQNTRARPLELYKKPSATIPQRKEKTWRTRAAQSSRN